MQEVIMPRVGMQIIYATLSAWRKKEGEFVKEREPLMEVTSEMSIIEFSSLHSGTLTKILVQTGETVEIGSVLALIDEKTAGQ